MHHEETQIAGAAKRRDYHSVEPASGDVRHTLLSTSQLLNDYVDKCLLSVFTLYEVVACLLARILVIVQHFQSLVDGDVEQIGKGFLDDAQ